MVKKLILLVLICSSFIINAEEVKLGITVIDANDGDTFLVKIDGNNAYNEVVRVSIIDTFETRKGNKLSAQAKYFDISIDLALNKGNEGKEFAKQFIGKKGLLVLNKNESGVLEHESRGTRLLGKLLFDNNDYATLIKNKGLAYDYIGKKLYENNNR